MCRSYQVTSISTCLDIHHLFVWRTFKLFQLFIQYLIKQYRPQRASLGQCDPYPILCSHYYKLPFPLSVLFLLLMMASKLRGLIHCQTAHLASSRPLIQSRGRVWGRQKNSNKGQLCNCCITRSGLSQYDLIMIHNFCQPQFQIRSCFEVLSEPVFQGDIIYYRQTPIRIFEVNYGVILSKNSAFILSQLA